MSRPVEHSTFRPLFDYAISPRAHLTVCFVHVIFADPLACADKCIDTLLDHVAKQIKTINETTLQLAEGMISPPWSRLASVRNNVTYLNSMLNTSTRATLKLASLSEEVEQNLKKKFKYAFVKVRHDGMFNVQKALILSMFVCTG